MGANADFYSRKSFERRLALLRDWLSLGVEESENPQAFLLGGQSGAGKTRLHHICKDLMGGECIVINGDEYRKYHPHFQQIQDRYGIDAPAHTAKWAGQMVEALVDAFSQQRYNLIVEGTLRTSTASLKTAELLRERGYGVSLAVMAVKPEISLVSCQIRYEMMRIAGTTPRAVDPEHHAKIVRDIVDNLSVLEESGMFETVYLYNRAAECLYPAADAPATASETLKSILFGDWTSVESDHLASLKVKLESLRNQAAPG